MRQPRREIKSQDATQYSVYSTPNLPWGSYAFLAGEDHGYCVENQK